MEDGHVFYTWPCKVYLNISMWNEWVWLQKFRPHAIAIRRISTTRSINHMISFKSSVIRCPLWQDMELVFFVNDKKKKKKLYVDLLACGDSSLLYSVPQSSIFGISPRMKDTIFHILMKILSYIFLINFSHIIILIVILPFTIFSTSITRKLQNIWFFPALHKMWKFQ